MNFDVMGFFNEHRIPYETEGHKHARPGWVNIECPFCVGNPGLHLGFNLDENYFHCWRCGSKHPVTVIEKLLKISNKEAFHIFQKYNKSIRCLVPETKVKIRRKAFHFPSSLEELQFQYRMYLLKRKFDPNKLIRDWELKATSPTSILDAIEYKYRILAPIIWDNKVVSFQARDITNRHSLKYKACPKDRELIHHKHILYGKQSEWKETGICVEGITDVWRLGFNSFATFGIKYTSRQLQEMKRAFKTIAVLFDGEEAQALLQANKLVAELKFRNVDAFRVDIKGDPADMAQKEADYLVKQIIK